MHSSTAPANEVRRVRSLPCARLSRPSPATPPPPEIAYAAIWEGWASSGPIPDAPRVPIPNRTMLLFTGPVDVLRDAPALAWSGTARGVHQEPHLVWPEDHAWCLACEVDEEIEFTVGCTVGAARALDEALPGAVRPVLYGESAPMYRD